MDICIGGDTSTIRRKFLPAIPLDGKKEYEMALISLETYNILNNITTNNNKFTYIIYDPKTKETSTANRNIPEGVYELSSINDWLQKELVASHFPLNSITFVGSTITFKVTMGIETNFAVDFTIENSIRNLLGFESKIYTAGVYESVKALDINHINTIHVKNSIISGSYLDNSPSNIIYTFYPSVAPGAKLVEKPNVPIYLPISLRGDIRDMETSLIDQDENPIDVQGERITMKFHIRERTSKCEQESILKEQVSLLKELINILKYKK